MAKIRKDSLLICKDCLLKEMNIDLKKQKIIVSDDLDLCEECGQVKPTVVKILDKNPFVRLRKLIRGY